MKSKKIQVLRDNVLLYKITVERDKARALAV